MSDTRMSVAALRQELPITQKLVYFQTGSYGPTPDSVLQVVQEAMTFFSHEGAASPATGQVMHAREMAARGRLAEFLHVKSEELALLPNTSQAMQRILRGVRWQPGDEFVVSSAEHVSTLGACRELEQGYGVIIKSVPADQGDDVLLQSLAAVLTSRTRMVAISHVSTLDGRRLPVAEAAAITHRWEIPLMVDGAQAVGQIPVDIGALGCDYYFASGHKWLLGPMGLGFLYVAPDRLPGFRPDFVPDLSTRWQPGDPRPPLTTASRVEQGTHNYAIPIGLGRAIEVMASLGLENIEAYTGELAQTVFQEVGQWHGVKVAGPTAPGSGTGLLSLVFDGYSGPQLVRLVQELWQAGIVVKYQPEITAMRVSLACFNTRDEVYHFLETLKRLREV